MTIDGRWEASDCGRGRGLAGRYDDTIVAWFQFQAVGEKYAATIYDCGTWTVEDDDASISYQAEMYFAGEHLGDFIARLQELQTLAQSRFGEDWGK